MIDPAYEAMARDWLEADWMDNMEDPTYRDRAIAGLATAFARAAQQGKEMEQGIERCAQMVENDFSHSSEIAAAIRALKDNPGSPLQVLWLCVLYHSQVHRALGREQEGA